MFAFVSNSLFSKPIWACPIGINTFTSLLVTIKNTAENNELIAIMLKVININNYERFWEDSTPTGHQIRIVCQDDSTLHINLNWPKGYNPRLHKVDPKRWSIGK